METNKESDQDNISETSIVELTYLTKIKFFTSAYVTGFVIIGFLNNIALLKSELYSKDPFKKNLIDISITCNFALSYLFIPIAFLLSQKLSRYITYSIGCLITSLSFIFLFFDTSAISLLIFYGITCSFGTSLIFLTLSLEVRDIFRNKEPVAASILATGSSIGTFAQSMFIITPLDHLGVNYVLLIYGLAIFILLPLAYFINEADVEKKEKKMGEVLIKEMEVKEVLKSLLKNKNFYIFCISQMAFNLGCLYIYTYMVSFINIARFRTS